MEADITARFAQMADVFGVLEIYELGFLVLLLGECLWDFWRRTRGGYGQTLANFAIALVGNGLEILIYGTVFVVTLFTAEYFAPIQLPVTWWSWILAVLAADFTYYWMHRVEHRVRLLWTYHSVHHSSPEFNFTTALRLSWLESLIEWVFFVPMILIGFDAVQAVAAILIVIAYQNWIHSDKIGRLGPLEGIFNTPSAHRVHHAAEGASLDRNFGGLLMIWDRLFGTYEAERNRIRYGLTEPLISANPITINFRELADLIRAAWTARSPGEALRFLFKPPGWTPKR